LLEHGADPAIRDDDSHTPLHAVARWGELNVTQRLLELGSDGNSVYDSLQGQTYFDFVAQWCKDFTVLLLERGADPCVRDNDGQTPLHVASHEGNTSVAQKLLNFGVDVNSPDRQGRTPLQIAVEEGHDQVEKLLLKHGAERP